MNVEHKDGAFFMKKDGAQVALLTYSRPANDRISLDHTEVEDALRGEGAGKQLVKAAVEYARAQNLKIIPRCPFTAHVFKEEQGWRDVL